MRRIIRVMVLAGAVIAAASVWSAGAAWVADFTPSTYNPDVNEVVEFAVCQECTGSEPGLRYSWDFNNDGVVDEETGSPTTRRTFSVAVFYEVRLTVRDSVGHETTRVKGIVAGPVPVYGVRNIVPQNDGSYMVVVSISVNTESPGGFGITELIPLGWSPVPVDDSGSFITSTWKSEERAFCAAWVNLDPGTQLQFSYILTRNYGAAAQRPGLSGTISGYAGGRYERPVCGELAVP